MEEIKNSYLQEIMERPKLQPKVTRSTVNPGETLRDVELDGNLLRIHGYSFANDYGEGGYGFDCTYLLSPVQRRFAEEALKIEGGLALYERRDILRMIAEVIGFAYQQWVM